MSESNGVGDWSEYQRLVMSELKQLREDVAGGRREVADLRVEMTTLKVKAGLWGMVSGAIPAAVAILLHIFGRKD